MAIDAEACSGDFDASGEPEHCPEFADMEVDAPVTDEPTVTGLSPAKALVGTAPQVTITGTGFATPATIQAGPSITVSNISVKSPTTMTATFTIQNSKDAEGEWDISVSVADEPSDSKAFFVQLPSSLKVLSATVLPTGTTGDVGCTPGTDFGIRLDINYQVLDQQNPPQTIADATMVPHETANLIPPVDQDICPSTVSTCKHTTASDGTWHDAPLGGCANGAFNSSFKQNITIIVGQTNGTGGVGYAVRTNNVNVSSSSSGHGSISNGLDINESR